MMITDWLLIYGLINIEMTYDIDPDVTLTLNHTNNGTNRFSIPENLGIEPFIAIIL